MSAAKVAQLLWTGLLSAMKADGLIANCIESTGPQTTTFLNVMAMENIMKDGTLVWIPASIPPNRGAEVFAISTLHPNWPGDLLRHDAVSDRWLTRTGRVVTSVTHYMVIPSRDSAMVTI
jgi:hypothetical protein